MTIFSVNVPLTTNLVTNNGVVQAKDLKTGDSVYTLNQETVEILNIKRTNQDGFDITNGSFNKDNEQQFILMDEEYHLIFKSSSTSLNKNRVKYLRLSTTTPKDDMHFVVFQIFKSIFIEFETFHHSIPTRDQILQIALEEIYNHKSKLWNEFRILQKFVTDIKSYITDAIKYFYVPNTKYFYNVWEDYNHVPYIPSNLNFKQKNKQKSINTRIVQFSTEEEANKAKHILDRKPFLIDQSLIPDGCMVQFKGDQIYKLLNGSTPIGFNLHLLKFSLSEIKIFNTDQKSSDPDLDPVFFAIEIYNRLNVSRYEKRSRFKVKELFEMISTTKGKISREIKRFEAADTSSVMTKFVESDATGSINQWSIQYKFKLIAVLVDILGTATGGYISIQLLHGRDSFLMNLVYLLGSVGVGVHEIKVDKKPYIALKYGFDWIKDYSILKRNIETTAPQICKDINCPIVCGDLQKVECVCLELEKECELLIAKDIGPVLL